MTMTVVKALAVLLSLGLIAYGGWILYTHSVERPAYKTLAKDGRFELREYPELVVAEATRTGDRRSAVSQGFGPLARYIFAKQREGDKIAMTAPVTQQSDAENRWTVRFIMPSKYTIDTLPRPEDADVRLVTVPPKRVAAIRFSGVARDGLVAAKEAELRNWMKARGVEPAGTATYAYYNDPFTIGFLRRNEVMFDIEGMSQ